MSKGGGCPTGAAMTTKPMSRAGAMPKAHHVPENLAVHGANHHDQIGEEHDYAIPSTFHAQMPPKAKK
jgi:hypothetical protein